MTEEQKHNEEAIYEIAVEYIAELAEVSEEDTKKVLNQFAKFLYKMTDPSQEPDLDYLYVPDFGIFYPRYMPRRKEWRLVFSNEYCYREEPVVINKNNKKRKRRSKV